MAAAVVELIETIPPELEAPTGETEAGVLVQEAQEPIRQAWNWILPGQGLAGQAHPAPRAAVAAMVEMEVTAATAAVAAVATAETAAPDSSTPTALVLAPTVVAEAGAMVVTEVAAAPAAAEAAAMGVRATAAMQLTALHPVQEMADTQPEEAEFTIAIPVQQDQVVRASVFLPIPKL